MMVRQAHYEGGAWLTGFGLFVLAVFRGRSFLAPLGRGGEGKARDGEGVLPAVASPLSVACGDTSPQRGEEKPCADCPILEEMDELRRSLEREIALMDLAEFRHG